MFNYEKRLEYPVHITRTDPKAAMVIISQYGGLYSASLGVDANDICQIYLSWYIASDFLLPPLDPVPLPSSDNSLPD